MPEYKITYFNSRGRAECARLLLSLAGVPFEDKRVTREEWMELKPQTKFGVLPMMEVDGQVITQSRAMMYYLAREFGYYSTDHMECAKIDEAIFILEDLASAAIKAFFAKEEEKEEKLKDFAENQVPKYLGWLEKLLKENDKVYLVGEKLTVADVACYDLVSSLSRGQKMDCLASFPLLTALVEKVGSLDGIKTWVANRPETQF